jgi:hypothetical protein
MQLWWKICLHFASKTLSPSAMPCKQMEQRMASSFLDMSSSAIPQSECWCRSRSLSMSLSDKVLLISIWLSASRRSWSEAHSWSSMSSWDCADGGCVRGRCHGNNFVMRSTIAFFARSNSSRTQMSRQMLKENRSIKRNIMRPIVLPIIMKASRNPQFSESGDVMRLSDMMRLWWQRKLKFSRASRCRQSKLPICSGQNDS